MRQRADRGFIRALLRPAPRRLGNEIVSHGARWTTWPSPSTWLPNGTCVWDADSHVPSTTPNYTLTHQSAMLTCRSGFFESVPHLQTNVRLVFPEAYNSRGLIYALQEEPRHISFAQEIYFILTHLQQALQTLFNYDYF